jgi:formylglycine-generating enzyme required for sulfatase activity
VQATPVTQLQWYLVMGKNPSAFAKESAADGDHMMLNDIELNASHPVEKVSWEDVQEFLRKLNAMQEDYDYRLPTEAEWEFFARAGTGTAYSFGDDPNQLGEYAHFYGNSGNRTHAVATKRPNPGGLFDVHGNVWEWVQDWYAENPDM